MSRKTTLIQIAEAAGVSLSTVDRVVNGRGGVSPRAEIKVLEWVGKLELDRKIFRSHLKKLRVAILMHPPEDPFSRAMRDAFSSLAPMQAGLSLACFLHYADTTDIGAIRAKVSEIAAKYDALILVCPDDSRLSSALRLIADRLPLVTMVTDLPKSGRIAYVGPDNRQMGRVVGELMGRFLGEKGGGILLVVGIKSMIAHEEREAGFRVVLRERFPTCQIMHAVESNESPQRAGEMVARILADNPKIRGIYNTSVGNSVIAKHIRRLGRIADITLITHEMTPSRYRLLREGVLDAVIDQNPRQEAQRAIEVIARHFQRMDGLSREAEHTPFDIFIRENCPQMDGV